MATEFAMELDTSRNVLVVGDDYARIGLIEAIAAAGGRTASALAWDEVATATLPARLRLVALDLRTPNARAVQSALTEILVRARDRAARIVVAIDADQIDEFSADLIVPGVDLLVAPATVELVGAVALAMAGDDTPRLHDISRDAARLERLNQDVARIAETLARLTQRGDQAAASPRPVGFVANAPSFGASPMAGADPADANEIRQTIRARRMRDQLFGREGLFEDPAWDMLLDLFAARIEHRQVSVSSLCIAAAVAPTTALRWIGKLIDGGLLDRRPDAFDKRRAFIGLTDDAAAAMHGYVSAVKRAGLPIA